MKKMDSKWIETYRNHADFSSSVESQLRADNIGSKKSLFFSDTTRNPDLLPTVDYKELNTEKFGLVRLRDAIEENEQNEIVRATYLPRIEELIGDIAMLQASSIGDTETFMEKNVESYGNVDPVIFNATLHHFREIAKQIIEDTDSNISLSISAKQVMDLLPDGASIFPEPGEHDFKRIQRLIKPQLHEMFTGITFPREISGDSSMKLAQQAMDNLGLGYNAVAQRKGLTTMSANHEDRQMKIPMSQSYDDRRFKGMLGHEGYVHINERMNGEKQPLQILSSGLAHYLGASEGKGVLFEQVQYPSIDAFKKTQRFTDIARRYLSVGLSVGADSNGGRDFVEVFSILNAVDFMMEMKNDSTDVSRAVKLANDRTWELMAMRTQRGYTGRGAASMKDKIYAEANPRQWDVVMKNPKLIPYLNVGKYDASNPDHLSIMNQIGAIPSDII